jgi:hypothetical protein
MAPVDSADSHHLFSSVVFAGAVGRGRCTGPVVRSRARRGFSRSEVGESGVNTIRPALPVGRTAAMLTTKSPSSASLISKRYAEIGTKKIAKSAFSGRAPSRKCVETESMLRVGGALASPRAAKRSAGSSTRRARTDCSSRGYATAHARSRTCRKPRRLHRGLHHLRICGTPDTSDPRNHAGHT